VVEEGSVATTEAGLRKQFEGEPQQRVAIECGTHSPWISRLLKQLGHQVIVANARKVRAISQNESKSDKVDAEMLAQLAYSNPKLLSPLRHRSAERQRDLNLIRSRDALVRARTMLINAVRGLVKSAGRRPPACDAGHFDQHARPALPAELKTAAAPLLNQIASLTSQIHLLDASIDELAKRYPEIGARLPASVPSSLLLTCSRSIAPTRSTPLARLAPSWDSDPSKASRAIPILSSALPKPATSTCAACWCKRPITSWAASGQTRRCAAGDCAWPATAPSA
jgi:transposase